MTPLLTTRRAALGAGLALAGARALAQASGLTDEQRSALKQANADPTLAPDLLLPEQDLAWWRRTDGPHHATLHVVTQRGGVLK